MKTLAKYLLFIAVIVDTLIVWAGVPFAAFELINRSIDMQENSIILTLFIIGLIIWVFGRGWKGMESIAEAYRKIPPKKVLAH